MSQNSSLVSPLVVSEQTLFIVTSCTFPSIKSQTLWTDTNFQYKPKLHTLKLQVVIICGDLISCGDNLQSASPIHSCSNYKIFDKWRTVAVFSINSFQSLVFLIYPLLGHLADVYLTRYRTLKCGIIAIVVSLLLLFFVALTNTLLSNVLDTQFPQNHWLKAVIACSTWNNHWTGVVWS